MSSLVILGASGFLGRALIASIHFPIFIKAVARRIPQHVDLMGNNIKWFAVDLMHPKSLDSVLGEGDVVINAAYALVASKDENRRMMQNTIDACIRCRVARLVQCSTAVVAGATKSTLVVETTLCMPLTLYEQTKWLLEQQVLDALSRGLDVGILRPTAIVGPGGQNLLKLAGALQSGNEVLNYLRASFFGKRPMHLVSIRDVTAALCHLAFLPTILNGNVYIVSSDDDPENNFQSVEANLLSSLGLAPRKFPLLPLPLQVLSLLLRLMGRSDRDMQRMYGCQKLLATNFKPVHSVAMAVREFGHNIQDIQKEQLSKRSI